jgi:hypothetical protein
MPTRRQLVGTTLPAVTMWMSTAPRSPTREARNLRLRAAIALVKVTGSWFSRREPLNKREFVQVVSLLEAFRLEDIAVSALVHMGKGGRTEASSRSRQPRRRPAMPMFLPHVH